MRQPVSSQYRLRVIVIVATGMAAALAGGVVAADSAAKLRYAKRAIRAPEQPSVSVRVELPNALRIVLSTSAAVDARPDARRTRPHGHDHDLAEDEASDWAVRLDSRARAAGNRAADQSLRFDGRREYYRVGFYEGLRIGFLDRPEPRWAWFEGQRTGRRDRTAGVAGRDAGRVAAERVAVDGARERVREQFHDLSREPRFLPSGEVPRYDPRPLDLDAPRLRDVVSDYPVLGLAWFGDHPRDYLTGFEYDTWRLIQCPDYTRFYDDAWRRADVAWTLWRERRGTRLGFFELDPWERERFAAVFAAAFERRLALGFDRYLGRTYDSGFDDGWVYGSFLAEEMLYREGYQSGYRETFGRASRFAFERIYPRAFDESYRVAFDDWSRSAKLEIGDVRLSDADDDGLYSPGERLIVEYTLVNYGGVGGEFAVELDGRVLAGSAVGTASAPARTVTPQILTVGRIGDDVSPRTRGDVELRVAAARRSASLTVYYPLVLERQRIRTLHNNLSGEVTVEIPVENLSRRAVSGRVRVAAGSGIFGSAVFDSIEPHEHRTLTVALSGIDPLSLIAGDVTLGVEVVSAGTVHDRYRRQLPDVYRDLENRELLQFMVGLALGEVPSAAATVRSRNLMIRRLQEDWKVASMGSGNPYKTDYRQGSTETALGDLVRTVAGERDRLRNSEVFAGLSGDVLSLSRTLPGTHPFLRKYVRRLAVQLP